MNRNFKLWPTISSISTKRRITEKDTTYKRFYNYLQYTHSQNIVNQRIKIIWNKKIKMSSQGSQPCLRSPMSSQGSETRLRSPMSGQGSQTWLRSPMSSQGSQIWLRSLMSSQGSQTWLRSPMSSQGCQTWLRSPMP
jgi:hypothetical protein